MSLEIKGFNDEIANISDVVVVGYDPLVTQSIDKIVIEGANGESATIWERKINNINN